MSGKFFPKNSQTKFKIYIEGGKLLSNKTKILVVMFIILIICLCIIISRAYAKNNSQIRGKGNAEIAKWDFKVNGEETQIKSVNLKNTNIKESLTEGKIAPGTQGFFEIIVDASEADVGIDYEIKFENETKKPSNLIFRYENIESKSLKDLEETLKGSIKKEDTEKIKIFEIEWEWKYENGNDFQAIHKNDELDTKEALQLTNYTFDILVSGTQSI